MADALTRWRAARQWLHTRPLVADTALAMGLVVLENAVLPHNRWPANWWAGFAVSLAFAVPTVFRRVAPALAVGLALAAFILPVVLRYSSTSLAASFVLVTYATAARFPLRRAILTAVLLWTPVLLVNLSVPPELNPEHLTAAYLVLSAAMIAVASFFVGRTVHNRRAYTASLEERAQTAEENQRAVADQAVAEERRRIARELHDVVAHHVSVMGVLATGARRVLDRQPAAADEALRTIEETGRTVLREMRRLLTVLRTETEQDVELTPQPGVAGIESLVEQVREAGLPVTLRVTGESTPLDPGVALTLYRIVQEALTNTLKHAGDAMAEVRLDVGRHWLLLEVFDTGRGPRLDAPHLGHGLLGMRERVALYGGTLRTGPRPGGGYRVYARIPLEQLDGVKGNV